MTSTDDIRAAWMHYRHAGETEEARTLAFDTWLSAESRAARAETWDEAMAAVFAWWSAPEDERPIAIVNPYGAGLDERKGQP